MTTWIIYDDITGELEKVLYNDPVDLGLTLSGKTVETTEENIDTLNNTWDKASRSFVPKGLWMSSKQIYNLFTFQEKSVIHTSEYPQVQGLLTALLFSEGPIEIAGTFHQQGVALLHGLGYLTEERAARVSLGLPPVIS